ncbi:MAG: hypothetical protein R3B11_09050 [Nitrospira sp.]|nr:hypothetical protein [Nitrospira sp.]
MDSGLDPQHIDDQVRFRTTYYFRVLSGCRIDKTPLEERSSASSPFVNRVAGEFKPLSDSLYRFRMTGQAAALYSKVHFESGVLKKSQIDPFGSAIRYNEQTNSFIHVSADELQADAKRQIARGEVHDLRALYQEIKVDTFLEETAKRDLLAKVVLIIEDRLEQLKQLRGVSVPTRTGATDERKASGNGDDKASGKTSSESDFQETKLQAELNDAKRAMATQKTNEVATLQDLSKTIEGRLKDLDAAKSRIEAKKNASCSGRPSETRYYLLGPEGAKELDPNDRLLLALSLDSKPIVGVLQQLSARTLRPAGPDLKTMERFLEERGRIFDAQKTLHRATSDLQRETGPTDQSKLEDLLDTLRKPFATTGTK